MEEYFDDFIGLPKSEDGSLEKIELHFYKLFAPYLKTKPINTSQSIMKVPNDLCVKIEVIPNFELEQLILSFVEGGVKVISPEHLKLKISTRLRLALNSYF